MSQKFGGPSGVRYIREDVGEWGEDPTTPATAIAFKTPLKGEAGFGIDQDLVQEAVFMEDNSPTPGVLGMTNARGTNKYGLEFCAFGYLFKDFCGVDAGGSYIYTNDGLGHHSGALSLIPVSYQVVNVYQGGTTIYDRALGCVSDRISLDLGTNGAVNYNVDILGKGSRMLTDLAGLTVIDPGYLPTPVFTGYMKKDDVDVSLKLVSFSPSFAHNMQTTTGPLGGPVLRGLGPGNFDVSGQLALIMEDDTDFLEQAIAFTPSVLDWAHSDKPSEEATKWVRFILPKVSFSVKSPRPGGAAGKFYDMKFSLVRPTLDETKLYPEVFGTKKGPYAITLSTNDKFPIKIDGGATVTTVLTAGAARTAAQIVGELNAAGPFNAVAVADVFMGRVRFRSKVKGSGSTVQFDTGTAGHCGAALGFANTAHTGRQGSFLYYEIFNEDQVEDF